MAALALGWRVGMAAEYLLPEEFVGSYLAARSPATCLREDDDTRPIAAYLVVQPKFFRYGYLNPLDEHSLDAMVCRATSLTMTAQGSMDVQSECFMTDRLVNKHFRFTKRAGVLHLLDVARQTNDEFEICY